MAKRLFVLVSLLILVGCGAGNAETAVPTPTTDPSLVLQASIQATIAAQIGNRSENLSRWLLELNDAEALWEAAGVHEYTLSVLYVNSPRNIVQTHHLRVQDGAVVEESVECNPKETCIIQKIDPNQITVPGLFAIAHDALRNDEINDNGTEFNWDPMYGVPEWISLRSANYPVYWQVLDFAVIEE
ncbi:MAG: hypothetical protein H6662_12845 [Ardenticatenaceae bacterium]|nr:hypothetical protein [Anaerolineales bacterium]MCB8922466.1 hypothetical protein [Ardenticatenaceae bacterium]MCB8989935.1 hypothetical protein [Ardenticatenaceae bacterium]